MYTAENLRQDLLANMTGNSKFPPIVSSILQHSEFQFNDTNYFTRVIWNTYKRNLVIFCAANDRIELEKYKDSLYSLCNKIHGTQDDYLVMSLEIVAKAGLLSATNTTVLTDDQIEITTSIIIDRSTDRIGHGGFGSVYKYYDEEKETIIAVKIYEPSIFQDSSPEIMKKRFLREGKKLLNYSHPNVVKTFDYGFLGDDSAYIKMEYIAGERICDYVSTNKPLNSALIEKLCYQYIDAMAYIHSQTDMHRDISYSNVMITNAGEVKVLDFGFARNADDTNYDTEYKDIQRKFVIPTEKYTFRTEVYCIGAILYTLITGNTFDDYDSAQINNADCDSKLKAATKICLSYEPEKRFSDATELKRFVNKKDNVTLPHNFSLDFLKEQLNNITLHFYLHSLPTKENVAEWLDTSYREHINSCIFQSTINLITILMYLSGVTKITYCKNRQYNVDKTPYVELLNFYDTLSNDMKDLFVRNLRVILLEVSQDDDYNIPF